MYVWVYEETRYELTQCTRCGALFGLDHAGCVDDKTHTAPHTWSETKRNCFTSIDAALNAFERLKRRYPKITVVVDRDEGLVSTCGDSFDRSGLGGIKASAIRVELMG